MIQVALAFVFLVALVFQTTLFNILGRMQPDAALIAALYFGVNYMKVRGYQFGILAGLTQDIFSHGLMGINLF